MSNETKANPWWTRKFIQVLWLEASPSGRTDRYEVRTKDLIHVLGHIKWYSPWRRYCFFPGPTTVFDSNCLKEISEACEHRTKLQKSKK